MLENLLPIINAIKNSKQAAAPSSGTMIEMTYKEIEQAAVGGSAVLFPISALEEYGPHLPIGTNTFLTNRLCRKIQEQLRLHEKHSIIAPPIYWGRNHSTGSFPGSFNLTSETMLHLLVDLLSDFERWEFKNVIMVNIHGETHHNTSLLQSVQKARTEKFNVFYLIPEQSLGHYKLNGDEAFLIPYSMPSFNAPSLYVDLHAGTFETSWMEAAYPEHVKSAILKTLQPTKKTPEEAAIWSKGWDDVKRVFPLGYCGDPATVEVKKAEEFEVKLIEQITGAILQKGCL